MAGDEQALAIRPEHFSEHQSPFAVGLGPGPMLETPKVATVDLASAGQRSPEPEPQVATSGRHKEPGPLMDSSVSPRVNIHERLEYASHEKAKVGGASTLTEQQMDFDLTTAKRDSSFVSGVRENNKVGLQENPQKQPSQQEDDGLNQECGAAAFLGKQVTSEQTEEPHPPQASPEELVPVKVAVARAGAEAPNYSSLSLSPSPAVRRRPVPPQKPKVSTGFATYMGGSTGSPAHSPEQAPSLPPLILTSMAESTFKEEPIPAPKNQVATVLEDDEGPGSVEEPEKREEPEQAPNPSEEVLTPKPDPE